MIRAYGAIIVDETIPTPPTPEPNPVVYFFSPRAIDADGNCIVAEIEVEKGGSVSSLQAQPDLTALGLTADGWTHSLTDLSNITHDIYVGAMYKPTDGKTHVRVKFANASQLTPSLYLTLNSGTLYIDYGDGSDPEVFTATGNVTPSHKWPAVGEYDITVWAEGDGASYNLGRTSQYRFFGGTSANYYPLVTEVILSGQVKQTYYAFHGANTCTKSPILPRGLDINVSSFSNWQAATTPLVIPPECIISGSSVFSYWSKCEYPPVYPKGQNLNSYVFQNWFQCKYPIIIYDRSIPNYVTQNWTSCRRPPIFAGDTTTIGNYAFSNWYACKEPPKLPDSCTNVGDNTFEHWHTCREYPDITKLTTVGSYAFGYWYNAGGTLSNMAPMPGSSAFAYNNNPLARFENVSKHTTFNMSLFQNWTALEAFPDIPANKTTITGAATSMYRVSSPVIIPENISNLSGAGGFQHLHNVPYFEFKRAAPPSIGASYFPPGANNQYFIPIYVPNGSVEAYKTAINWVNYADRIRPRSELDNN